MENVRCVAKVTKRFSKSIFNPIHIPLFLSALELGHMAFQKLLHKLCIKLIIFKLHILSS